jgi:hypothetical protein
MRKVTVQNKVYTRRLKPLGSNQSVMLLHYCLQSNVEFQYSTRLISKISRATLRIVYCTNSSVYVTKILGTKESLANSTIELHLVSRSACEADDYWQFLFLVPPINV